MPLFFMLNKLYFLINPEQPEWPFGERVVEISHRYCHPKVERLFNQKVDVSFCSFVNCRTTSCGGAIYSYFCSVDISTCKFYKCRSGNSGACLLEQCLSLKINDTLFAENTAKQVAALQMTGNSNEDKFDATMSSCNFSRNKAEFVSALRVSACGGLVDDCIFSQNEASKAGAVYDFIMTPNERRFQYDLFLNNTSDYDSAALTLYHHSYSGKIQESFFIGNVCKFNHSSVILQSDGGELLIVDCVFTGSFDEEVNCYYKESKINTVNNKFEIKASGDDALKEIDAIIADIDP